MKKILFGFMFAVAIVNAADSAERPVAIGHIVASSTNIGTAYNSAGSTALLNLASASKFTVLNDTASDILVSLGEGNTCQAGDVDHFYVPAGLGFEPNNPVAIKKVICVRSLSGTISSGDVWVSAY